MTHSYLMCGAAAAAALATLLVPVTGSHAQITDVPQRAEPYTLHTGVHSGMARSVDAQPIVAYRSVIDSGEAPWVRVHFGDYDLGEGSMVVLRSHENADVQHLDGTSMNHWNGSSGRFVGGVLDIELHVAPGDDGVFVEVTELTVGEWVGGEVLRTVCGSDDRVSSTDPGVGRLNTGCTGWIISTGSMLTAGHCGNIAVMEFQVPASLCDGTPIPAAIVDQYPIIASSRIMVDGPGGNGDDWGIYSCGPNTQTGLLPIEAQQKFFRITKDFENPANVRITGYGDDFTPPGCSFGSNMDASTQQTSVDEFLNEGGSGSDVFLKYKTDTEGGNSGSPVIIMDSPALTIGVHTTGGCDAVLFPGNFGTSFENDALEAAINDHPDPLAVFADNGHPLTSGFDGTSVRPYRLISAAAANTPSGGLLSIVTGAYDESVVISMAMDVAAPVGPVVIGSSTLARGAGARGTGEDEADPSDQAARR